MRIAGVILVVALAAAAASAQTQQRPKGEQAPKPARGAVEVRPVFEGQVLALDAARAAPRLDIRVFSVRGGQRMAALALPFRGFMIVELRAGEAVTIIDGQRVERREGEIWSVPPGSEMRVETDDDTAVLQTTLVSE